MGLITYENLEDGQKVTANVFNERFAQIVAQINGQLDENNLLDNGISKAKLKTEVYESMYPVGSMYVNFTDNTNPATLLGFGTWQAVEGRMVVGYDATQTEFNASEKTGGHKKLQAHTHSLSASFTSNEESGNPNPAAIRVGANANRHSAVIQGAGALSAGEGDGENLPPYVVGYIWKRTS